MKPLFLVTAVSVFAAAILPLSAADDCCGAPAPKATASSPTVQPASSASATQRGDNTVSHPLRGVIVAVLPAKSALLVKHEEIPGVMSAMTMLLKVDEATLAAAKKDQAITALLVKKSDGWWLQEMKVAESVKE